jgi:protein-S-isoprenylcysteine O-methyltransferase Ste14
VTRRSAEERNQSVSEAPWWRGKRGEWYVVAQVALVALIAFSPRTLGGWPSWQFPEGALVSVAGWALLIGGAAMLAAAMARIGAKPTPLPHPPANAVLQVTGVYRVVRHPMYCGVLLAAFGWALLNRGWLALLFCVLGSVFIDLKARREEQWLLERFPGYADYRRRVRKLIPFVY